MLIYSFDITEFFPNWNFPIKLQDEEKINFYLTGLKGENFHSMSKL